MILIFDDNSYRREALCKKIYMNDLYVRGESYEHCEYITKPLITILVCPSPSEASRYLKIFSAEGTTCVFVLKREISELKGYRNVFINKEGEITPSQVREIINQEYKYNLKNDYMNYMLIDEDEKDVYFGAKKLFLTDREYSIVKFFAYNPKRMFTIDEILDYMHLRKRVSETTFYSYVSCINSKCYKQNREDIILRTTYGYGITPVTGKFKP